VGTALVTYYPADTEEVGQDAYSQSGLVCSWYRGGRSRWALCSQGSLVPSWYRGGRSR
jgi:hypothetical protein